MNPRFPAPVNSRSLTFNLIVDALFGAFAQAVPGRVPAAGCEYPIAVFGGFDPSRGRPFVFSEIGTGGFGARSHRDGIDVFRSKAGNTLGMPVETTEMDFPVRIERYGLRPDSGGAGRFRGGLGYEKIYEVLADDVTVSVRGERHRTAPWGLEGGQPGRRSETLVVRRDGTTQTVPSKKVLKFNAGDRLVLRSAGGGGFGDPMERPPEAVLADVLDGKIAPQAAETDYGVVLRGGARAVDRKRTFSLREQMRRPAAAPQTADESSQ